jgi:hypothetical protein
MVFQSGAAVHLWNIPGKNANLLDRRELWDGTGQGVTKLSFGGKDMEG